MDSFFGEKYAGILEFADHLFEMLTPNFEKYDDDTLDFLRIVRNVADIAGDLAQEADRLYSGHIGEEEFRATARDVLGYLLLTEAKNVCELLGTNPGTALQPRPSGSGREIAPLVQDDIRERVATGSAKYGGPLRAHNGRDALVDAYQEALDLALYLRQAIEERGGD